MARFPKVYRTAEWERVRQFVIQRAQGLCEECLRQGRVEAGTEVDHIRPLDERNWRDWDVAYNPDNLQLLCRECHAAKHGGDSGLSRFIDPAPVANSRT
jgi:5-methylcytosine-specific restriction endonuclease McrA